MFAFFMQQLFSVRPIIAGAYLRRSTTLMSLMDSLTTFYQKQKTKQKKKRLMVVTHELLMNFKALGNFGLVLRNVSLVLRKNYPGNGFKLLVSHEMKWFQMVLISYCVFYV